MVDSRSTPRLLLASRSPRRLLLLREAGFDVEIVESGVDDSGLVPGRVSAAQWAAALAHLKAHAALQRLMALREAKAQAVSGADEHAGADEHGELEGEALILGADTLVEVDGRIIGQPADAADARRIILELSNCEHEVITGVGLLHLPSRREVLFADTARVSVGRIPEHEIEAYVATGQWRGKAGAYNLFDRLDAGWPIEYEGDPTTVVGLPMERLRRLLSRVWAIEPGRGGCDDRR